jgi:hypothetical protein
MLKLIFFHPKLKISGYDLPSKEQGCGRSLKRKEN